LLILLLAMGMATTLPVSASETALKESKRDTFLYQLFEAEESEPGNKVSREPPAIKAVKEHITLSKWHSDPKFNSGKLHHEDSVAVAGEDKVIKVWHSLFPEESQVLKSITPWEALSLPLDPVRYQLLEAHDGAKILLDRRGLLPPLVTSLITEKYPAVRIVSENQQNPRKLFRSLFAAAGFYSVEEDFTLSFGTDPVITITTDFKIEKNVDSLLHNDIALLNVGANRLPVPSALHSFLEQKGFRIIGQPVSPSKGADSASNLFFQITSRDPVKIADSLLEALSIPYVSGRIIELKTGDEGGASLELWVDRYFELAGRRYAVVNFEKDPANYTLIRLIETKGYNVITLEAGDSFRTIMDKFLDRLSLSGRYGMHDLWNPNVSGYGIQLTGFLIRSERDSRTVFITDREVSSIVKQLANANGYRVINN
jgi:hypothetical protein